MKEALGALFRVLVWTGMLLSKGADSLGLLCGVTGRREESSVGWVEEAGDFLVVHLAVVFLALGWVGSVVSEVEAEDLPLIRS